MTESSLLPGLPPYGELPRAFPASWGRLGREGVVVRFLGADGHVWLGNFQPGLSGVTAVHPHPDGRRVLVFAEGDLWVVEPEAGAAERLTGPVDAIWPVEDPQGWVMSFQGLAFTRLAPAGIRWHTRRLSWDGFADVQLDRTTLTGRAWNPVGGKWEPFEVDLESGRSQGGSYGLGDPEGWERLAS